MINIGINCANVESSYVGGVNTFTKGIIKGLLATNSDIILQIYVTVYNKDYFSEFHKFKNCQIVILPFGKLRITIQRKFTNYLVYLKLNGVHRFFVDYLFGKWSKIISLNSDLVYTPTTVLFPYKYNIPSVLSMHDTQHLIYPHFFTKRELMQRNARFKLSAEYSNYIQASSDFMASEFLNEFKNLKKDQVFKINEGVDLNTFNRLKPIQNLDKYSLPSKFIFYPAQIWPHKNHVFLLRILKNLQDNGITIPLVMTGAKYEFSDAVFDYIKVNNLESVFYLGKVPIDILVTLYKKCHFFITTSLYESSCLPYLEAAACGAQIVASNIAPNLEMANKIKATLFNKDNAEELKGIILEKWHRNFDKNKVEELESILPYSWDNIALEYYNFFIGVLNK